MFNKSLAGGLIAALLTQTSVAQDVHSVIARASHVIGATVVGPATPWVQEVDNRAITGPS
jgi:hypothetical protein